MFGGIKLVREGKKEERDMTEKRLQFIAGYLLSVDPSNFLAQLHSVPLLILLSC